MAELSRIRKQQLSGQTVHELIDWLSSDSISVGDKLPPEHEIMQMLGVGRSTIREAIKVLEHLHFLDVRVGSGTYLAAKPFQVEPFLARLRRAELKEVQVFKLGLELQIAYLACTNHTREDLDVIYENLITCQEACKAKNILSFAEADFEFHKSIAKAAHSNLLYDFYLSVREIINILELEVDIDEIMSQETMDLHNKLYESIKAGDKDQALSAWFSIGTV